MFSFSEHKNLLEYRQLEEKLILFNNGARYGQIVFLAGGAGSGKGFAIKNFMEGNKFKIRDVDEWKKGSKIVISIRSVLIFWIILDQVVILDP